MFGIESLHLQEPATSYPIVNPSLSTSVYIHGEPAALLDHLAFIPMSQEMDGKQPEKKKTNGEKINGHGGSGRGQGDKRLHVKQVADPDKFPRLHNFFIHKPSEPSDTSRSTEPAFTKAASKRPRTESDATTSSKRPPTESYHQEPPDIAPVASSYLLGKGGIISQALSSLRSGACLSAHPCLVHSFWLLDNLLVGRFGIIVCQLDGYSHIFDAYRNKTLGSPDAQGNEGACRRG